MLLCLLLLLIVRPDENAQTGLGTRQSRKRVFGLQVLPGLLRRMLLLPTGEMWRKDLPVPLFVPGGLSLPRSSSVSDKLGPSQTVQSGTGPGRRSVDSVQQLHLLHLYHFELPNDLHPE